MDGKALTANDDSDDDDDATLPIDLWDVAPHLVSSFFSPRAALHCTAVGWEYGVVLCIVMWWLLFSLFFLPSAVILNRQSTNV